MDKRSLMLYAITDRSWLQEGEKLETMVEDAILGGATIIQLREKELTGTSLKELAISVKAVCEKYDIPFIINDDVMLAKEIDADGVHVGQADMAVKEARAILGPDKIVGATAKTIEQAKKAEAEGASYLGSGAIFGTTTKKDALPMTKDLLVAICNSVSIPVVAIGGIDNTNIEQLRGLPIAGAAVVSAIFSKADKVRAAMELKSKLFMRPVIQCITNYVTAEGVANAVLARGGSPIMAHHIEEVEEVQTMAGGLVLNLGATDDYLAMKKAYRVACELGHPVVIDPVGVSGISYRRDFLKELFEIGVPSCIRGNFAEIRAIYEDANIAGGLDDDTTESDEELVCGLAKRLGCVVVATGRTDIVSDGEKILKLETGHELQKKVTGSGCMLSAVICVMLAFGNAPYMDRACYATNIMGRSAEAAALITLNEKKGIMTFYNNWLDLLSL